MHNLAYVATTARPSLEDLAFYCAHLARPLHLACSHVGHLHGCADGTDKARDDHKYTDLYSAIFDPIRDKVANITEIGVAQGQSLQVWHDYFEKAHIWGVDIHRGVINHAREMFQLQPRVHLLHASSKSPNAVALLGLRLASMDVVRCSTVDCSS